MDTGDRLLTPGEVAALFRVDPKTVTRWAAAGRIGSIRTPGGHRRFRESEVRALLEGDGVVEEMREDDAANRPRNSGPTNPGIELRPAQRRCAESRFTLGAVQCDRPTGVNSVCGTPSASSTLPATKSTNCWAVACAPAP